MGSWNQTARDYLFGRLKVFFLIVEKNVRTCGFEDRRFFRRSDEVGLVGRGPPLAKGVNDPFMRWRVAGRYDRDADPTRTVRFHELRPKF